jgi:2-polyprenyl-3-methyl-5-hydroxy-6-metoxy-1,4-benzoquinol methylase
MSLKRFYEEFHESYKPSMEPRIWQVFALKALSGENLQEKLVLDVGSGYGYILRKLLKKGLIPHAIDFSNECISFLHKHGIDGKKLDISYEGFPYEDNKFDYVIFTEVIEHLVFPDHTLKEIFRVLKPNGKMLISTHNSFNFYMRFRYLLGKYPSDELISLKKGLHVRLFNLKNLVSVLNKFGFRIEKNNSWFQFWRVNFFVPNFLTSLFSRHFLFLCFKSKK